MTDNISDKSQDDRARPSPVLTTPPSKRTPSAAPEGQASTKQGARSPLAPLALVVALASLGLSGALWMQHRDLQASHAQLVAQLEATQAAGRQADTRVQELSGRLQENDSRIGALDSEIEAASAVIRDLDEALRTMTDRGSDIVLLNDVDHLATIAQQQLELGGNVRNAIVAMESAQAQLARANRPALASLMQTVNGDLDRLRAASTIDVAAFSRQMEQLAILVTEAPLIVPDDSGRLAGGSDDASSESVEPATPREQPAPTVPPATEADTPWWEQAWDTSREWSREAWDSLRDDLGRFIDVRRVDDANALLMSPDQAARFRENLRTRIMTAQLALMMRQPEVWKTETAAIVQAIETRYDQSSPMVRKALRMAQGLADASIDEPLPTVSNTLQALNALREEQRRDFRGDVAEPQSTQAGEESSAAGETDPAAAGNAESGEPQPGEPEPGEPQPTEPEPGVSDPGVSEPGNGSGATEPDGEAGGPPADAEDSTTQDPSEAQDATSAPSEPAPEGGAAATPDETPMSNDTADGAPGEPGQPEPLGGVSNDTPAADSRNGG